MPEHQYMHVTAIMIEPVIYYEDGMHLDGILSYGAFREYNGPELPPINSPWAIDFDLPLKKWRVDPPGEFSGDKRLLDDNGMLWGWCASRVDAEWFARGKMEYRKRPDIGAMQRFTTSTSHNIGAGALKAFDVAYPTLMASEHHWHAIGYIDAVRRLLSHVTHIGKKSTTGMGAVSEWVVEPCYPVEIVRRMPNDRGRPYAIRPPYHHASRRVPSDWSACK
jgi:hypothetical protein